MPKPPRRSLPEGIATALRYVWSITSLVWKTLCAALLPISLAQIPTLLPRVIDHLTRHDPHRNRESALERCRRTWVEDTTKSASDEA